MGKNHPRHYLSSLLEVVKSDNRFKCWWCGTRPFYKHHWNIDHLVPTIPQSHAAAACSRCNKGRGGKLPDNIILNRLFDPTQYLGLSAHTETIQLWLEEVSGENIDTMKFLIASTDTHCPIGFEEDYFLRFQKTPLRIVR